MKKAANRFSTKNLADRLNDSFSPSKMGATPQKQTPEIPAIKLESGADKNTPALGTLAQSPSKTTPELGNLASAITKPTPDIATTLESGGDKNTPVLGTLAASPNKTTPDISNVKVSIEKTTVSTSPINGTPEKPTPTLETLGATPNKTTSDIGKSSATPTKPSPSIEPAVPTPNKPTSTIEPFAATPNKPTPSAEPLASTPSKPTPSIEILAATPTKPSANLLGSEETPTKPSANLEGSVETPIKPSAELGTLGETPTKPSAELGKLGLTPEKQSAQVSELATTPNKTTAELSALGITPEKPSAALSILGATTEKPSAEVSALATTPDKTTAELSTLGITPDKTTATVSGLESTPDKTTPDVSLLQATPDKTTPNLGVTTATEKTTVDVSKMEATPEKTTANIAAPPATPDKTTPDLGVTTTTEKTTAEIIPMATTPEKTTLDVSPLAATLEKTTLNVSPLASTPEKTTLDVSALAATLEKTTLDPIPFASTIEKTTDVLGVRDGFANRDQNGFITGKASGLGLLTDFTGISGLPGNGTGQYEHTGVQGLGTLATRNGILEVDANGFTPNQKHLGASNFIGISGDPGSMTYTIPDGPSPRASYRYNKEMQPRITGAPQTFTTPGGFLVTGTGASGTLTADGINFARNSNSAGNSQLLEQYNKFDLRQEAFHRMDGFTSGLGQPYIDSKVLANDNTSARGFKGSDGLVRGGIVARVVRTVNDAVRIGKFLISPTGLLFIAKNIGMQLTNPKVETFAGIDGGGFFARTTRIYPLGLSTLAQIVADVAPVGTLGLIRHGLGPFEGEKNYYEQVVDERKKLGGWDVSSKPGAPTGNRLIKLHRDMEVGLANDGTSLLNILDNPKAALGSILGGAGGALSGFFNSKIVGAAADKLGALENFIPGIVGGGEIDLLSGLMGPNSIYGIGSTIIRKSTSGVPLGTHNESNGTWADSKIVLANHDKGVGTLISGIDDTHKGLKTNPNNHTMVSSPTLPYSDQINSQENDNSIHTDGDNPAANYNDMATFEKQLGGLTTMTGGNAYFSEGGYADGQRFGADGNPAGQNNRDKKIVDRFPLSAESDLYVDNTLRDSLESSRLTKILDEVKDDTSPAGLKKYNDLPGDKTEQIVHSSVEKDSADPYGPTFGNIGSYEVFAYGDIPKDQLAHNKIMDFRSTLTNTNKTFQQDEEGYKAAKREVEFGQNYGERGVDRSDREAVLKDITDNEIGDKILIDALNSPGDGNYAKRADDGAEDVSDLITLRIAGIQFRAYLKSFSHNMKPEFQNVEYIGRLTDVKLMSKFSADFALGFSVVAMSARELEGMYFKLNRLAQKSAPTYAGGLPQGPMNRITVGDYFKNQLCFINSVGYTMNEQSPWDIDPGRQLPYYLDVEIGGDIITSAFDNLLSSNSDFFGAIETGKTDTKWKSANRV